ncbi:MAG: TolC family protein, partial [Bryobacteraceae bacterium]
HAGALSALYAAVGTPLGNVEPQAALDPPLVLPPLETLRHDVLANHPAIALAESEMRRSEAVLEYEKAQKTPQPSVWADWFHQPDVAQYRFGVTVTLPVRNRREGPIAEAVAVTHQTAAVAQQRRLEITADLERAYNLYQVAQQQVTMFEAGTLRGAEAAVAAAEAAFRFGERGILEVLDAQRVLRATRLDYLNSQYDRQLALIDLEQLRALTLQGGKP